MDWIEANLKDLVEIKTGKKDANEGDENGSYRFYTCAKDYSFIKDYAFDEEAILISGNGAYVGYVHYYNGKFDAYQRTYILSDFKVNVFFLFHYLGENLRLRIHREKQDNATPYIKKGTLAKFKIQYPENPFEQTAIATILSKVDEAIAATQNSIKAAEKLKKALMQNLLTGKLKPDGSLRTEDEFYETKIGLLPKNWEVKTVKELSTQVTDGEHTTPERADSGYYLLSARNIKNGFLDLSNVDYVGEKELKRIQKRCNPQHGDILISCSGTIGNVCMVPDGLNAGMVRSTALVKLKTNEIEPDFAELVFQSFLLQNQMKVSVASSVQGNIFQGAIKKLKMPYPASQSERIQIAEKIKNFNSISSEKQNKIQMLQRLKKSLMQNLLTGKVRLPQEFIAQFEEAVEEVNKTVTAQ